MSGRRHTFAGDLVTHAVLIVFTAATLYPVLWVVRMAFTPSQAFAMGLSPIPETISLDNFVAVVGRHNLDGTWVFGHQLYNSLVIALCTSLVGITLSTTAAYAMSRFRFPGRQLSLSGLLVTQMFPGTMMMIPLYILLDKMGLLDHQLGLILVYATTAVPFCTWSLKGYFAAGAIVVSIPVMALFFALQRNLVAGLTAGAVKG
ncbi:MAG: hypothetical protein JXR83_00020 [Deltaproteobacteria bacterium]|nr:hypothetical protein [Deltaproteobacteria bacterium]